MNPWASIIALLAIVCLIVAYKGTQDNLFSAIAGKKVGDPNISGSGQGSTSIFGIPLTGVVTPSSNVEATQQPGTVLA